MKKISKERFYEILESDIVKTWRTTDCKKVDGVIFVTQYYLEDGRVKTTVLSETSNKGQLLKVEYREVNHG